jgi:hypothetical protein
MLIEQWLGSKLPTMNTRQAKAELVRRYLHCYGPSNVKDFAEWAGISIKQAAVNWQLVERELVEVSVDGQCSWLRQADAAALKSAVTLTGIRLLPPHDPYLAARDRLTLIPDKTLHKLVWRATVNPGLVLANGELTALWRTAKKGNQLIVQIESFTALSKSIQARVEAETQTLAAFKGCTSVASRFEVVTT